MEVKWVFNTEAVKEGYGILFKKSNDPMRLGLITQSHQQEIKIVFFEQDERTKIYERDFTEITPKEVVMGEVKIEDFPLNFMRRITGTGK